MEYEFIINMTKFLFIIFPPVLFIYLQFQKSIVKFLKYWFNMCKFYNNSQINIDLLYWNFPMKYIIIRVNFNRFKMSFQAL